MSRTTHHKSLPSVSKIALSLSVAVVLSPTITFAQNYDNSFVNINLGSAKSLANLSDQPISLHSTIHVRQDASNRNERKGDELLSQITNNPHPEPVLVPEHGGRQTTISFSPTSSPKPSFSLTHHESLGEKVAKYLRKASVPDALIVFVLSALPVLELRAGVPAGFLLGLPAHNTLLLAVVGNLLPIIPLLFLLRLSWVQSVSGRLLVRARALAQNVGNAQSRALSLALFVGVPLPGTGAWTGALVSFVLGMPFSEAVGAISLGVFMAATIMTALCALGWVGAAIAASVLCMMAVLAILRACGGGPFKQEDCPDKGVDEQSKEQRGAAD